MLVTSQVEFVCTLRHDRPLAKTPNSARLAAMIQKSSDSPHWGDVFSTHCRGFLTDLAPSFAAARV